ncbi:hypothetical protein M3Y98_00641800 [Aphelenchoides besseyi]|nr:hypothetical protein M3Y98_00641800 [Aphelenchoides besseyi]
MSATVVTSESHLTTNEKCCCCISLRAGTIAIGVISAIIGVLGIVNGVGLIAHNSVQLSTDNKTYTVSFSNSFSITQLISSFLSVVVSVLLIIGVIMRISVLFWPYIIYGVIEVVCCIGSIILLILAMVHSVDNDDKGNDDGARAYIYYVTLMLMLFLISLVTAYFIYIVNRAPIYFRRWFLFTMRLLIVFSLLCATVVWTDQMAYEIIYTPCNDECRYQCLEYRSTYEYKCFDNGCGCGVGDAFGQVMNSNSEERRYKKGYRGPRGG